MGLAKGGEHPAASVIIPLHRDNARFRHSLDICLRMPCQTRFEVIVSADVLPSGLPEGAIKVSTGWSTNSSPAVKRDCAMRVSRGDMLAFIDDDAFPANDWLDRGSEILSDPSLHAVGGPGLTPPGSPWRERLGGAIYESRLGSGPLRYRFLPLHPPRDVDDLPAYNLLIRREALVSIGGWSSNFYGGEDTKVCLELVRAGFRLRYDPRVIVYHYRKPVVGSHLKQVANVGRHRGFFVRRYPETSRRLLYFLPTIIALLSLPALALAVRTFQDGLRGLLIFLSIGWAGLAAAAWTRVGPAAVGFPAVLAGHHLAYGFGFLRGLLGRTLHT